MNILKLDVKKEKTFEKEEMWLDLKIDEKKFLDNSSAAVFEELENSLDGNGEFLIFTCNCGVADCAGWKKVIVKHETGNVIWTFEYGSKYLFEFDFKSYRNEIEKVRIEINKNKIKLQPDFIMDPEP
ncbi:MAG: hypothetical protein IM568_12690 [Flavobacterium sp.]|nr:hypothetical protein [Flavobacterium sp.]